MSAPEQSLIDKIKQLPPSVWRRWRTLWISCEYVRKSDV